MLQQLNSYNVFILPVKKLNATEPLMFTLYMKDDTQTTKPVKFWSNTLHKVILHYITVYCSVQDLHLSASWLLIRSWMIIRLTVIIRSNKNLLSPDFCLSQKLIGLNNSSIAVIK